MGFYLLLKVAGDLALSVPLGLESVLIVTENDKLFNQSLLSLFFLLVNSQPVGLEDLLDTVLTKVDTLDLFLHVETDRNQLNLLR